MSNYIQIDIPVADTSIQEILIAQLAEMGYEGFEESSDSLKAYIPEAVIASIELDNLLRLYNLKYSRSIIEKQNWNEVWESNFEPVRVGDFVGIRAAFHQPFTGVQHEIVITPKMSFGTGHHPTTRMIMQLMKEIDFTGRTVFDFGTGTGILAILAEKLGAKAVFAGDNDEWCIGNASENILTNGCKYIDIQLVSNSKTDQQFDVIIANINKNIILDNLSFLAAGLQPGGQVVLSGLLQEDEPAILLACKQLGWGHQATINMKGWIACWFRG